MMLEIPNIPTEQMETVKAIRASLFMVFLLMK